MTPAELAHLRELLEGYEEEITRRLDTNGDKERVEEARQAILDYVEELTDAQARS